MLVFKSPLVDFNMASRELTYPTFGQGKSSTQKRGLGRDLDPFPIKVGYECWMDPKSSSRYELGEILLTNDRVHELLLASRRRFRPIFDGQLVGENIPWMHYPNLDSVFFWCWAAWNNDVSAKMDSEFRKQRTTKNSLSPPSFGAVPKR